MNPTAHEATSEIVIAVIAGLVVLFIGWLSRGIWTRWLKFPREEKRGSVSQDHVVKSTVGNVTASSITNSPVATDETVNQVNYYSQSAATTEDHKITGPTPSQIRDFYKGLTPYQRTRSHDQYIGQRVCWQVQFESMHIAAGQDDPNQMDVSVSIPKSDLLSRSTISFQINIETHPRFKLVSSATVFWVEGRISRTYFDFIELEDVVVHWLD